MRRGDEGGPFVPPSKRKKGMGDEGLPLVPLGQRLAGMGDEGKPLKKKKAKKPSKDARRKR